MEVLQTSALPLGDGADQDRFTRTAGTHSVREGPVLSRPVDRVGGTIELATTTGTDRRRAQNGAGNGIRTRDFDLGKVALYH